jgi:hypothetical protein
VAVNRNRERRRPLIVAAHGLAGIVLVGYGVAAGEILAVGFGGVLVLLGVAYLRSDSG